MFPLLFALALTASALEPAAGGIFVTQRVPLAACADWESCRDLALAAHQAGDAERFHDLAWRAVQTRGRRDPDLLFVLARAQSVSGRPHDALVTLQRVAREHGAGHDISQDDDFRRVRALPGWPEAEAEIARAGSPATAAAPRATESPAAVASPRKDVRRSPEVTPRTARTTSARFEEVARFATPGFAPGGLAYDAVSRRFVIGNLPERKLTIVAEGTNRAATLSGDAARFMGVQAIEIDRRSGDLWVVSTGLDKNSGGRRSELHKLQLISGRVLQVYSASEEIGTTHFVDVAVAPGNRVLVLDAQGPRVFHLPDKGPALAPVMELPAGKVTSIAPAADGRTVYVAYVDRLLRLDLTRRSARKVEAPDELELGGFEHVRFHRGMLAGVQSAPDGTRRLVHLRLGRAGTRVLSAETLDALEGVRGPLALDVRGSEVYYLVPGEPEAVIRRIHLK